MADENRLNQSTAIHRRLKELLSQQRYLLCAYLDVLEKQQCAIASGTEEAILAYAEIEEKIAADMSSVQKTIVPLENLAARYDSADSFSDLKAELEDLTCQVAAWSQRNRDQLFSRMTDVRKKIELVRNSSLAIGSRRSLYQTAGIASFVNVQG